MIDAIGYVALVLNLLSMNMTSMLALRWLALSGNGLFAIYGTLIGALPIVMGTIIAVGIHAWQLFRLYRDRQ